MTLSRQFLPHVSTDVESTLRLQTPFLSEIISPHFHALHFFRCPLLFRIDHATVDILMHETHPYSLQIMNLSR
ncbi:hypothetical protein L596_029275 [Steinernema carpocapsae]|uniref:Uncharacterized protein n=1 Tax=Steinernema carpocapsae TaxID=34508 RepID=A0A4U5LU62_STECR|nr:hypothetical protein L596_029275 [Steinernema carpocapsae]